MIGEEEKGITENEDGVAEVTGLEPKTTYTNVYIKVYDNAGYYEVTVPISVTTAKEICYTTYCAGGTSSTCTTCGGTGKISKRCGTFNKAPAQHYADMRSKCCYCGDKWTEGYAYYPYFVCCSSCGAYCYEGANPGNFCSIECWRAGAPRYGTTHYTTVSCSCGNGHVLQPCKEHGVMTEHRYCEHYNNTTLTEHEID